jgi:hypothetical protein
MQKFLPQLRNWIPFKRIFRFFSRILMVAMALITQPSANRDLLIST